MPNKTNKQIKPIPNKTQKNWAFVYLALGYWFIKFMNKIKKGDNVKVLLGKDSGRTGTVDKVLGKIGKVIVGGINIYKRSVKKSGETKGGVIDLVKPVNISNVALICPNCKKQTRVGFLVEKGSKIRICKKCKKEIK